VSAGRLAAGPLLGLAAAVALGALAGDLDRVARPGQLGPGLWPRLVLAGLAASCLAKLLADRRRRRRPAPAAVASAPPIARGTLAAAVALIVLYVVATPWLGFPLATAAFIASFMTLAGARAAGGIAAVAVLGTVALLYLFIRVVYLPLPKGDGPFESLTVGLYRALGIF
jgi:putative tricarboxylic transport membrane protein